MPGRALAAAIESTAAAESYPETPDTSNGGRASGTDQVVAVKDFRSRRIPDRMVYELLGGKRPTLEEHLRGKELQAKRMDDPEWMRRLTAGDQETVVEFLDMSWCVGCCEPAA